MSGLLEELVSFLGPKQRSDVRKVAAESILGLSAGTIEEADRSSWTSVVVPHLVKFLGDQEDVAQPCRSALVNLAAQSILSPTTPVISERKQFWSWLVHETSVSGPLLVNLTAHPQGPTQLEKNVIGGARRATSELIATASALQANSTLGHCIATLRNLSVTEGAQAAICESDQALSWLLNLSVLGHTNEVRRDAVGTLRNVLLERDATVHSRILNLDGGAWLTASVVVGLGEDTCPPFEKLNSSIDDERDERVGMAIPLKDLLEERLVKRPLLAPCDDCRDLALDSLLLLATTPNGREVLRKNQIYPVIRAYHPLEKQEHISDKVYELVSIVMAEEDRQEVSPEVEQEENPSQTDATWTVD